VSVLLPGRNLVLIGLMGSGKTTVGELLARRLERPLVDTDEMVERIEAKLGIIGRKPRTPGAFGGPVGFGRGVAEEIEIDWPLCATANGLNGSPHLLRGSNTTYGLFRSSSA
jgi:hypothetical protein